MDPFKTLEQNYFVRDWFVETVNEIIPNLEDILSDRGFNFSTDDFHILKKDDEIYLTHLPSGTIINWYKHLGRTNTCNKYISRNDFKEFLNLLKDDLKEE